MEERFRSHPYAVFATETFKGINMQPISMPENFTPVSINQIRNLAKSLKPPLAGYGIDLPHTSILHVVSKAMGYENYNAAKALLPASKKAEKRVPIQVQTDEPYVFEDENFGRFMNAVRREIGEGAFEQIMMIHRYQPNGSDTEALLGLFERYGIISNKEMADICAREFFGENVENEGEEYWKKYELFANGILNPREKREGDNEIVACFWPRKEEKRKQIIIPYLSYANSIASESDMAYRRVWTFSVMQRGYIDKKIKLYEGMAQQLNIPLDQFDPAAVAGAIYFGVDETKKIIYGRYEKALRSLLIAGLDGERAKKIARWATMYLYLDEVNLNSFVSQHFDHAFVKRFRSDTSGKMAQEHAESIIYVHFIATSGLPVPREEWETYASRETGRRAIREMLNEFGMMRLVNGSLAVVFNKSFDEACTILAETCMENALRISLSEVEAALQAAFNEAVLAT